MKGSQIVVECLKSHGVTHIFGYPGGSVLPVYDALIGSGITHILSSHEQFACHAADGYARATGKAGVVLATSGPGATNLVTGIANAYMDSIPLVAITGNVKLSLLGHDAFQEIDITGVTMPVTKHNFIVKSASELASALKRAFLIANSGRKGPVLVDIPTDIFDTETQECDVTPLPAREYHPSAEEIENAVNAVNACKYPFICAGGGVIASESSDELFALAHRINSPVAVTAMGKGAFPAHDTLYAGVVGMNLGEQAKRALKKCDLFIAMGIRFSERLMKNVVSFAPNAKILHMDIDAAETGKNAEYHTRVVGDMKETLKSLLPRVNEKPYKGFEGGKPPAEGFFGVIERHRRGVIVTTEVGLHQIEAVNRIGTEQPRTFITSGGLGTMGFGLPAAIGASIGSGKRVVNVAGDGSFNMNMQELSTAARYGLPVTQVVVCNGSLGMIEKWQNEQYGGRIFQTKLPRIEYSALSRAFGVPYAHASTEKELDNALLDAETKTGPYLIVWEGQI
ncbi:MAG: thiamine pyrophosphate-binding protein [Clostridia bacterium]|nr:thiamine pyrophosphate-binding protein [Clostridia bacterium]